MVLDSIENAYRYIQLGKGIAEALLYIQDNDLSKVQPGRYEINHDKLVLIVSDSENTNLDECKLEGHRKYIDLQYWIDGSELMGHEILNSQQILLEYNEKTDCAFYNCIASYSRLLSGMFVIYFPTDLHTAVVDPLAQGRVKKAVFKIRTED